MSRRSSGSIHSDAPALTCRGTITIMMKHNPRLAAALIVISLAGCQGGSVATETAGNPPPAPTTVVAAPELHQLYDDHTCLCPDGEPLFPHAHPSSPSSAPAAP